MTRIVALALLGLYVTAAAADAMDWLRRFGGDAASQSQPASDLSEGEIARGLTQALRQGLERAVTQLSQPGGFLDDPKVKIPLPDSLARIESGLRAAGAERYADQFVATMNHAAEQAVGQAAPIFGDALAAMTVDDARQILSGPEDAATQYFRRVTESRLLEKVKPVVERTTAHAGVTSAYKGMVDQLGFAGGMLGADSLDIDRYVTEKTLDGLFTMVAEEERRIRQDPVARGTELLRKVFGSGS